MVGVNLRLKPPQLGSSCPRQSARRATAAVPLSRGWDRVAGRLARCSFTAVMRDRRGVNGAEYAILAVGIVIVVGAAVITLSDPTNSAFTIMGNAILSTQVSLAGTR
jgi:Flp pilus assembly pilin Flp